jgi:hypothetical protein
MMEALACHPLGMCRDGVLAVIGKHMLIFEIDTIKVRMQLSRRARAPGVRFRPTIALHQRISGYYFTLGSKK